MKKTFGDFGSLVKYLNIKNNENTKYKTRTIPDSSPTIFISNIRHTVHIRCPEFELSFPVNQGRKRSADQKWPVTVTLNGGQQITQVTCRITANMQPNLAL